MKARTRRSGYVAAAQYELPIDAGFCLVGERGEDGERIAREREEAEQGTTHDTHPELFTLN